MVMAALDFGRGPGFVPDLTLGLAFHGAVTGATWWLLDLSATYLGVSVALYAALSVLLARYHPGAAAALGPGLGAANRITFARSLLALPVVALVPFGWTLGARGHWWVVVLSTVAMSLDGLDGRVARRTETVSRFGARFDMELDAFLLLGLSVLAWGSGKVGAWILLVGGMRYLFVAAGWIWPVLEGELPESRRRKTVCVVQGVGLLVCLGPVIPSWTASVVGAGALALLSYSFAVDVRLLLSRRSPERRSSGAAGAEGRRMREGR